MLNGFLRHATMSQSVLIGPFIDDTDFKTPETGLTIALSSIKLSKNGLATSDLSSGSVTHRTNGMYQITFDVTDADTVGELALTCSVSGALPVYAKFRVVEESIFDALYSVGSGFPTNWSSLGISVGGAINTVTTVTQMAGTIQTLDALGTLIGTPLTGARTVTITVDDGTDPVEGATVRLTKGVETGVLITDVSGQVVFSADDGTWTVSITGAGYELFTPVSLVVDGNESETYSLTALTISVPASPSQTTVYFILLDSAFAPRENVSVVFKMITPPSGSGTWHDDGSFTVTSDANGLVQGTCAKGARYLISADGHQSRWMIPANAESTHQLPNVVV